MMERYTETPELIASVDSEQSQLVLEFSLINVEKENITLMINENGCYLSAVSEDSDYVATLSFISPVKPTEAKAVFSGGILTVKAPFKEPLQNYVKVPVE